jgi:broad specificity phosphatase PhoE
MHQTAEPPPHNQETAPTAAQRAQRLVLVRHGETVGQSSIRYFGRTDVPLSTTGHEQMERVRAALQDEVFDAVYTSALRRTMAAARIIAPEVPAQTVSGFNEVDFGDWEGLTAAEIERRDPDRFRRWRASLHDFAYPGGETVPAFRARVSSAWRALLPLAPPRVLIIAHRGVISSIVADLLGLAPAERSAWALDLACIHVLVATGGAWCAERVNDSRHLRDLP